MSFKLSLKNKVLQKIYFGNFNFLKNVKLLLKFISGIFFEKLKTE